jgi:hypothetical protein
MRLLKHLLFAGILLAVAFGCKKQDQGPAPDTPTNTKKRGLGEQPEIPAPPPPPPRGGQ